MQFKSVLLDVRIVFILEGVVLEGDVRWGLSGTLVSCILKIVHDSPSLKRTNLMREQQTNIGLRKITV